MKRFKQRTEISLLQEMEFLCKRMEQISVLSKELCSTFEKRRSNISNLSETNRTLKSLQFMLALPAKLQVSEICFVCVRVFVGSCLQLVLQTFVSNRRLLCKEFD